jgi:hypothetical protein
MRRGVCWFRSGRGNLFVARKVTGVKTPLLGGVTARVNSCPVTKRFSNRVPCDDLNLSK